MKLLNNTSENIDFLTSNLKNDDKVGDPKKRSKTIIERKEARRLFQFPSSLRI